MATKYKITEAKPSRVVVTTSSGTYIAFAVEIAAGRTSLSGTWRTRANNRPNWTEAERERHTACAAALVEELLRSVAAKARADGR